MKKFLIKNYAWILAATILAEPAFAAFITVSGNPLFTLAPGSGAQATFTIDGTNGATPALNIVNQSGGNAVAIPAGTAYGFNGPSGTSQFYQNGSGIDLVNAGNIDLILLQPGVQIGVGSLSGPTGATFTIQSASNQNLVISAPGTGNAVQIQAGSNTLSIVQSGSLQLNGTNIDQTFCAYNAGNLAAGKIFGQTTFTTAATVDTGSNIAQDVIGVGGGNFVVMACTDGATCAAGNQRLTWTESCTAAVGGTPVAATVQNSGTVAAGTTLTISVTTACATTDPGANVCVHYHY